MFQNKEENVTNLKKRKSCLSSFASKRLRASSKCSEIELTPIFSNSQQEIARDEGNDYDEISLADTVIGDLSDGEIDTLKDDKEIKDLLEIPEKVSKKGTSALIQSFSCIETTVDDSPNESLPIIAKYSTLSNDSSNQTSGSCIFCLTEPKNAVFVHSKFVHLCSCYKCAVKIFNKNKRCPICNCSVKSVLQVFAH